MSKWLFAALLLLGAHFAASYIVPLQKADQGAFAGLLRWAWPWSVGDGGLYGHITSSGFPIVPFFIAVTAAGALLLAALAVVGIWIPFGWWRVLAIGGAALSLILMAGFFGPTKLLPMALDLILIWAVLSSWVSVPAQ